MPAISANSAPSDLSGKPIYERLINHVFQHAEENDTESVLKAIEEFSRNNGGMMHVGPSKGKIVEKALADSPPKIMVELGAFCGYSAVRFSRHLKDDPEAQYISFELNPMYAAISTKIIEYAGLKDKVTVVVGSFEERRHLLRERFKVDTVDAFFIDHWKDVYVKDLKLIEADNLLHVGTIVMADNIYRPGAPEYKDYVTNHERFETNLFEVEMRDGHGNDAVAVSKVIS